MKGKPSAPEPCRQQVVRRPRPEGIPRQGGRRFSGHSMNSDDYWIILDALSHHIPGQGRPPGPSGGQAFPGEWRGVQGSPGGEGRDSLDAPSHRILRSYLGRRDEFR
jgi:hypothetical protein